MRQHFQRFLAASIAGVVLAAAGTSALGTGLVDESALVASMTAAGPIAKAAASGKSLVPHKEHVGKGTMYHALTERDAQIYFVSDAPLEKIKGQSNRVIGYVIAGSSGSPASLVGGEWHLPVASMKTGIRKRDEHMRSKDWLNESAYPDIVFQLKKVSDVSLEKESDAFATYKGTLVGDMTIHGVTNPVSVKGARITFMPQSKATASIAAGDLMAIRAKFSVTLSEYGVDNGIIGGKVAEVIEIDTRLYMSTVKPEDQPKQKKGE
jgi:polyisoprenoid-binding protein YceI